MELATGVIGLLLPKLHELLEENLGLRRNVRWDITFLIRELESLQGALRRVWSEKAADQLDELDKLWNKHAADLSGEIDGVVDKFLANISSARQAMATVVSKVNLKVTTARARHEFVGGIRNAVRLLEELVERHERYRVDDLTVLLLPGRLADPSAADESRDAVAVELPKDGDLRKLGLPRRLQADVAFLRTEMEIVRVVLRKLAEVPVDELDEATKAWGEDLREVCCDVKQVVDNFNKNATTAKARRQFAAGMRDLRGCFLEAAARHQRYDLSGRRAHNRRSVAENVASGALGVGCRQDLAPPEKLVAIDGARNVSMLISKLLTGQGEESISNRRKLLKLVCIVGPAGVGKTTLAREVYVKLKPLFDCTAWVSRPALLDTKGSLQDLLGQINQWEGQHAALPATDDEDIINIIINKIRRTLRDKRCFTVVDDILDLPVWDIIKRALIENNNGSAVLMTSRNNEIAKVCGYVHRVEPLSETDSWDLFRERLLLFSPNKIAAYHCIKQKAEICEKFVRKCGGIPLAIISKAYLLATKPWTEKEWYAVHDSNDTTIATLSQSYNDLPHYLKPCLLYLSMFQKGFGISGERLVWGWIAEGFISEAEGKSLREVGESYLCELIERKLIEPIEVDACDKILSCCVYDLVHDLIISKSTEENFATVFDNRPEIHFPDKVQRLSVQGTSSVPQEVHLSDVRSLVVSGDANLMPNLSDFRELRALDLGGCDSLENDHLKGIGNSFLLKYLVMGGNFISGIPKEIVNLKLLQTLDLRASALNKLPEIIFQLRGLERLCVNSHMKIPGGIGKMKGLQELFDVDISRPELLKEIGNLFRLRVLSIAIWSWDGSSKSYHEALLDYLRSLEQGRQQIHSLSILSSSSLDFMKDLGPKWEPRSLQKLEIKYGKFDTLPIWMGSFEKLTSLSIEVYQLSQMIIDMLGKLLTLKSLYLTSKYGPEGKFGTDSDGFKYLTSLHLRSNAMTEIFVHKPEAMQMLKRVKLSFQATQTEDVNQDFKFGLEHLCFVEQVSIEIICFNASRQVVQNAEDKIQRALSQGRSRRPNLDVRRIREKDIIETIDDGIRSNTEQEQKEDPNKKLKQNDESPTEEVPIEGVPRKYKIVSLDLENQILTLQAI
ncbi:hypothetical protein ACP4OV_002098 [Aristida adscensionis]